MPGHVRRKPRPLTVLAPEGLAFVGTSDLAGLVRGKSFPEADLDARMQRGVGITHSNILMSAFGPIYQTPFGTEGDLMLLPDPAARAVIPMADGTDGVLFLGDLLTTAGHPWSCCPRGFLRRALAALEQETGLALMAAFEQEFVYTGVEDRPGANYSLDAFRRQAPFGGLLLAAIRRCGIAPDSFLPEYGPRQYELTVAPAPALRAADEAVIARELARAVAAGLGHRAILGPMLTPDGIGNGTHVHLSLWNAAGEPAMHDPAGIHGLSQVAERFVAGILHHAPALAAITAPSAASYYRLTPNRWAPTAANLGVQDRGSALRICPVFAGTPESAARQFNAEYRVADAAASPYLALGALVWAGLDGITRGRTLAAAPQAPLPGTLADAIDALEACEPAETWFGREFLDVYLMFKRSEVQALAGLSAAEICARYAAVY